MTNPEHPIHDDLANPPAGAIAWKHADPTEDARWVFDEADARSIASEDPSLLVPVAAEPEAHTRVSTSLRRYEDACELAADLIDQLSPSQLGLTGDETRTLRYDLLRASGYLGESARRTRETEDSLQARGYKRYLY